MGNSHALLLDDVYGTTTNTISANTKSLCNFTTPNDGESVSLYEVGEKVLVLHSKQFWEAKVIDVRSGYKIRQYLVHYPGWSEDWNEWLGVEYLKKYNDDNVQHCIHKELNLNQTSEIKQKKTKEHWKRLKERLRQEEKKRKELKKMLRTLLTQLRKQTTPSGLLVEAAQPLAPLQQVPTWGVVDITEREPVGTPRRPNEPLMVEPEGVTTGAADLSTSWVNFVGPNVDLSHPNIREDLLKFIGLPKEITEQELKTHEEVLLSSVDHSLRTLLGLNVLCGRVKELSIISDNYQKEKEELEKKLREKSSVVDKLAEHFTRQFRKLLSERRAMEETLIEKEIEWEAKEADLNKQVIELKVEAICLRSILNELKVNQWTH